MKLVNKRVLRGRIRKDSSLFFSLFSLGPIFWFIFFLIFLYFLLYFFLGGGWGGGGRGTPWVDTR